MNSIIEALHIQAKVSDSTHTFYKYPARFSPEFARAVIENFSSVGDLVVDPFCGGGTSVVEALRLGRRVIGSDLNLLATFVAKTKAVPLGEHARHQAAAVADHVYTARTTTFPKACREHYLKYVPSAASQWAAAAISAVKDYARSPKVARFVRLAVLRTAQLTLDARDTAPTGRQLDECFGEVLANQLSIAAQYHEELRAVWPQTPKLGKDLRVRNGRASDGRHFWSIAGKADLIITSPPYVGVHMIYHRWQIRGRRETPFPYLLAGEQDGQCESYYTMGSRSDTGVENYFTELGQSAIEFRRVLRAGGVLAVLVGFSDPTEMSRRFIQVIEAAGFTEFSNELASSDRLWRQVPGRKWFARSQANHNASKERLLLFR
ncbi:MAG: hypothetical protein IT462_12635 [Planctomycetes bacterium]|nr:hypothetical protein [Planctomycetota bacterium]